MPRAAAQRRRTRPVAAAAALIVLSLSLATAGAADPAGCWAGAWRDCHDNHSGLLNARIVPCGPGRYEAVFTGTFFLVIPYRYTTALTVTGVDGGKVHFQAHDRLPFWGDYRMCGTICGDTFHARYDTCDGYGYFHLYRTCRQNARAVVARP